MAATSALAATAAAASTPPTSPITGPATRTPSTCRRWNTDALHTASGADDANSSSAETLPSTGAACWAASTALAGAPGRRPVYIAAPAIVSPA
ncbi:hypothetical protein ACQPX6_15940 [Actinomycetospora sp. CA-101289]|uniref:hypothetical protein n=1 Tax=Actinomycetospora sp. CA-101289 TaxID=3239893 RepID=UPI003D999D9B